MMWGGGVRGGWRGAGGQVTSRRWCHTTRLLPILRVLVIAGCAEAQTFTNVTLEAGIDYRQYDVSPVDAPEAWFMSGGAAAVDVDLDGWVDLFVTRMDQENILYLNKQDGTFQEVLASSIGITITNGSNGCAWADVDNDGDSDLYLTTIEVGRNLLYLNQGNGQFVEDS
ncbi:MAG: hypothetical protein ACI9TH_004604, partial [Kiritimatiellia bacterium]